MRKIRFEYQRLKDYTIVTLDARLKDFRPAPKMQNGRLVMQIPSKTVKDCRHIDGCVYYHLGHATDSVMVDLIEKFQKLLQEKGWKEHEGIQIDGFS